MQSYKTRIEWEFFCRDDAIKVLLNNSEQIGGTRAIDSWSLHGCVGFHIPVSG
jgi:hypothetical protein